MSPVAASAKTLLYGEEGHVLHWLMAAGGYLPPQGRLQWVTGVPSWQVPVRGLRLCGCQWGPYVCCSCGSAGLMGTCKNSSKTIKGDIGMCEG